MNEYFRRTPDSFNYDGAQHPGEGNLYDLRVATRDEIERLDRDITYIHDKLTDRIAELERITKIQAKDIDYNDDRIRDLMAAGTVDHGKYAHLTEAQIEMLVKALEHYAFQKNGFAVALSVLAKAGL